MTEGIRYVAGLDAARHSDGGGVPWRKVRQRQALRGRREATQVAIEFHQKAAQGSIPAAIGELENILDVALTARAGK